MILRKVILALCGIGPLFLVSFLWQYPLFLGFILLVLSAVMLLYFGLRSNYKIYLFCAIFGAAAEAIAIFFGTWTYSLPNFSGIPLWLPFLWGIAGVFIKQIANPEKGL